MKRFVTTLAAAALGAATLPTPAVADPPSPAPPQGDNAATLDFCVFLMTLDQFEPMNLGECVSYNSVSAQGFVPHDCDRLREFDLLENSGYVSYSECVRSD